MKKIIRYEDLDIVKKQKVMEKKIDKALERKCLICSQIMNHIGNFTWYCKKCDTLTTIQHTVSIRDKDRPDRKRFIEYDI